MALAQIKKTEEDQIPIIGEDQIMNEEDRAFAEDALNGLEKGEFIVHYQPQYNHSNGLIMRAEALARWQHPQKGMLYPVDFIPKLEQLGYISKLDEYVFKKVCLFQKKQIKAGRFVVPVSVNISQRDCFTKGFAERLEEIRRDIGLPSKYVHLEITESYAIDDLMGLQRAVTLFHKYGYIVEMDDFGSGYSSLNLLKYVDFDILKLDMKLLEGGISGKGGTIIDSVVRMAKWLGMPIVSEGVETAEQANFMQSLGCDYLQGFLYSRPVPEEDYDKLLLSGGVGADNLAKLHRIDPSRFWEPESAENIFFSHYAQSAALISYNLGGTVEVLRVNKKYLKEFGMNMSEYEVLTLAPWKPFDEENRDVYEDMLRRAIESEEEEECETCRTMVSDCCGKERMCIRSSARLVGKMANEYIFYISVRNITVEKGILNAASSPLSGQSGIMAAEHLDMYFWDYDITTKDMHPCFRCMKYLGLPPLVKNYPEPLFERNIIPPEWADRYRELMGRIDSGETSVDLVVPFTLARVPYRVRYTTEFDENGRPVRAFGSAVRLDLQQAPSEK